MTALKTLIVDDEKPARDRLKALLAKEPAVQIVGEARNAREAIEIIGEHRPQLLFLDIKMPGESGFQVLRAVPSEILPRTIFTTAYDEYAVDAFAVRALDYLLKPFTPERLHEALSRALEEVMPKMEEEAAVADLLKTAPVARGNLERLLVKINERYLVVRSEEIDWVEAAANYVVLHTKSGNHVLRKALSSLDEELPQQVFFRASRSAIVNLNQIVEIQSVSAGEHVILLRTGAKVSLTRGLRELQDRLQGAGRVQ
ncbi:MAG TPA: LytTR family DNA-binding domain-containing protein [Opitutaceae bacterium]|nr:LytTR family DNA-binding domain-containing protein [Opitutaceae bacterium]